MWKFFKENWAGFIFSALLIFATIYAKHIIDVQNKQEVDKIIQINNEKIEKIIAPLTKNKTTSTASDTDMKYPYYNFITNEKTKHFVVGENFTEKSYINNEKLSKGGILSNNKYSWFKVVNGQISAAYFYAEASIQDNVFLKEWNDALHLAVKNNKENDVGFYMKYGIVKLNNVEKMPPEKTKNKTVFLYPLNAIEFIENNCFTNEDLPCKENVNEDLMSKLNNGEVVGVRSYVSSARTQRRLKISIYYQCINDENCSIVKQ